MYCSLTRRRSLHSSAHFRAACFGHGQAAGRSNEASYCNEHKWPLHWEAECRSQCQCQHQPPSYACSWCKTRYPLIVTGTLPMLSIQLLLACYLTDCPHRYTGLWTSKLSSSPTQGSQFWFPCGQSAYAIFPHFFLLMYCPAIRDMQKQTCKPLKTLVISGILNGIGKEVGQSLHAVHNHGTNFLLDMMIMLNNLLI